MLQSHRRRTFTCSPEFNAICVFVVNSYRNHMKKPLLLTFFLLIASSLVLHAAYFSFQPYQVSQPDGTPISCFVSGDEYFNWLHDQDGYTIIQASDGFFYYGVISGDFVAPSSFLAGKVNPAAAGLKPWAKISQNEYNKRREFYSLNVDKNVKAPHQGVLNNIVIYIRFQDDPEFTTTRQVFDNKFNPSTGNTLKSYYTEVSYNSLLINSTYYPACPMATNLSYQDSHDRNYFQPYNATTNPGGYNGNTERTTREHTLLRDAVEWININSSVPDSLNLDGDNDGKVDNVCFIIEGINGAWADLLWAHRWVLFTYDVRINGKRVYDYTFQPQTQVDPNTLCHEMFHALGAPDLYHYSYDGFSPVGNWDIMESGLGHMGAYMKWKYADGDWIPYIPEITKSGIYSLKPLLNPENNCYQIASPYNSGQFFVLEYRKKEGTFEGTLPGSGLLVYRIDPSVSGNASGPPDEVYIYRPGGTKNANGNVSAAYYSAGAGRTAINDATNPSSFLQDGSAGGLNISKVTTAGDSISFTVNLSTIKDPSFLAASTISTSRIDLNWNKNISGNKVMIAFSLTPVTGFPEDGVVYTLGSTIPGGGVVIYSGEDSVYTHTGLSTNTTYYYTAWSVTDDIMYSPGLFSSATTFCEALKGLPFTEGFEETSLSLNCWTQQNANPAWQFTTGNGTGAGYGYPSAAHNGSRNALLKDMTTASNKNSLYTPVLDLSGYVDVHLKYWVFMRSWVTRQDELRVLYRNDPDSTWILLTTFTNSINEWTEEDVELPSVSSQFQIAFQGDAKNGFGVCLDDIEITGTSTNTLSVTPAVQNVTPLAGNFNYSVSSNTSWSATSDVPWCNVTNSGSGNGTIVADYTENATDSTRSATITITALDIPSQHVSLVQRAKGVSVQENAQEQFRIFPNPSNGKFSIIYSGRTNRCLDITILDLTGRIIHSAKIDTSKEQTFDLSGFPAGFYIVRMNEGTKTVNRRLLITK